MKIKELGYEGNMLRIVFDVGDGTTIKHRTTIKDSPMGWEMYNALREAETIAHRMIMDRKNPDPAKIPEALKKLIGGNDVYRGSPDGGYMIIDEEPGWVYDDPDYTVGPGPITPHALLDAGD